MLAGVSGLTSSGGHGLWRGLGWSPHLEFRLGAILGLGRSFCPHGSVCLRRGFRLERGSLSLDFSCRLFRRRVSLASLASPSRRGLLLGLRLENLRVDHFRQERFILPVLHGLRDALDCGGEPLRNFRLAPGVQMLEIDLRGVFEFPCLKHAHGRARDTLREHRHGSRAVALRLRRLDLNFGLRMGTAICLGGRSFRLAVSGRRWE